MCVSLTHPLSHLTEAEDEFPWHDDANAVADLLDARLDVDLGDDDHHLLPSIDWREFQLYNPRHSSPQSVGNDDGRRTSVVS